MKKFINSKYFGITFVGVSTAVLALIDFVGICELSIFAILSPMALLAIPIVTFLMWFFINVVFSLSDLTSDIVAKIENIGSDKENEDQ